MLNAVSTPSALAITLGSGLASALLYASLTGGTVLAVPLFILTAQPILIAALGWGTASGLLGAAVAALAIGVAQSPMGAGAYLLNFAVPALLLAHLVGLARVEGERTEWYPLGRVVLAAGLVTALAAVATAAIVGASEEFLAQQVREMVLKVMADDPRLTDAARRQFEGFVTFAVRLTTIAYPIVWTTVLVANLWIAAKVVAMSGRLARPWEDLARFTLPNGAGILFALAFFGEALPGVPGQIAAVFTGALGAVHALLGLAVIHVVTRGSAARPIVLASLYGFIFLFSLIPAFLLVVLGLAERFLRLRDRRLGGPPAAT